MNGTALITVIFSYCVLCGVNIQLKMSKRSAGIPPTGNGLYEYLGIIKVYNVGIPKSFQTKTLWVSDTDRQYLYS
jgi:hypothetical protein